MRKSLKQHKNQVSKLGSQRAKCHVIISSNIKAKKANCELRENLSSVESKWINNFQVEKDKIITKCLIKIGLKRFEMVLWQHWMVAQIFRNCFDLRSQYWNNTQIELLNSTLNSSNNTNGAHRTMKNTNENERNVYFANFCTFWNSLYIYSRASHYLRITFYICINIFCAWRKKKFFFRDAVWEQTLPSHR